jgi:hypothetical protein
MKLKDLHFVDIGAIQVGLTDELNRLQKQEFFAPFQELYDRAKACIYVNGTYFE